MTKIRICRDPQYAPCGFLVMRAPFDKYDEKNTVLVQTDWDFPGVASSFGWSPSDAHNDKAPECEHPATDGTVKCCECGQAAGEFISDAFDFLCEIARNETEVADPGYFSEDSHG